MSELFRFGEFWLDRPGFGGNETDELICDDAHIVINNNGTFLELRRKLEAFVTLFGPGANDNYITFSILVELL